MIPTKHFVGLTAALLGSLLTCTAQIRPYLKADIGFRHLYIPSENLNTHSGPLYTGGVGCSFKNFGLELTAFTTRYVSDDLHYRYLQPDFYYTDETYKQVFTRKGLDATLHYRYALNKRWALWIKAGASYYEFKPSIEADKEEVRTEVSSFSTYWQPYHKIIPLASLRASYALAPYLHLYAEGGYGLTVFHGGILIGKLPPKKTRVPKEDDNRVIPGPDVKASQPANTIQSVPPKPQSPAPAPPSHEPRR